MGCAESKPANKSNKSLINDFEDSLSLHNVNTETMISVIFSHHYLF